MTFTPRVIHFTTHSQVSLFYKSHLAREVCLHFCGHQFPQGPSEGPLVQRQRGGAQVTGILSSTLVKMYSRWSPACSPMWVTSQTRSGLSMRSTPTILSGCSRLISHYNKSSVPSHVRLVWLTWRMITTSLCWSSPWRVSSWTSSSSPSWSWPRAAGPRWSYSWPSSSATRCHTVDQFLPLSRSRSWSTNHPFSNLIRKSGIFNSS